MTDVTTTRDVIRDCLHAGDREGAWRALEARGGALDGDRSLALLWLETLQAAPTATLETDVGRIVAAFAKDQEIGAAAVAALVAAASGAPIDAPPIIQGPATQAAALAEELLHGRDVDEARRAYLEAQRGNALRLAGRDRDNEALALFEAALTRTTSAEAKADTFFDLGLFHKARGRFADAEGAFRRSREAGRRDKRLHFNLAVAATALGRGDEAKEAWAALGIPVEVNAAGMPYGALPGPVEVRVPTRGSGHGVAPVVPDEALSFEVVSVAPISPCHGVVQRPTLRDAPVDYGDVILWDGTPVAMTEVDGRALPRFPLLEILRRGDERRFRFVALEQSAGDLDELGAALPEGAELFPLEARVEVVCPRCAAGDAFVKHDHEAPEPHRIIYGKVVATPTVGLPQLAKALTDAMRGGGRVSLAIPELYDALGDPTRAGQEHQAFRGIEQVALRKGLAGTN